ncbi:MAG: hypothetical protein V4691_05495 [Pseudomonadota bacterium]
MRNTIALSGESLNASVMEISPRFSTSLKTASGCDENLLKKAVDAAKQNLSDLNVTKAQLNKIKSFLDEIKNSNPNWRNFLQKGADAYVTVQDEINFIIEGLNKLSTTSIILGKAKLGKWLNLNAGWVDDFLNYFDGYQRSIQTYEPIFQRDLKQAEQDLADCQASGKQSQEQVETERQRVALDGDKVVISDGYPSMGPPDPNQIYKPPAKTSQDVLKEWLSGLKTPPTAEQWRIAEEIRRQQGGTGWKKGSVMWRLFNDFDVNSAPFLDPESTLEAGLIAATATAVIAGSYLLIPVGGPAWLPKLAFSSVGLIMLGGATDAKAAEPEDVRFDYDTKSKSDPTFTPKTYGDCVKLDETRMVYYRDRETGAIRSGEWPLFERISDKQKFAIYPKSGDFEFAVEGQNFKVLQIPYETNRPKNLDLNVAPKINDAAGFRFKVQIKDEKRPQPVPQPAPTPVSNLKEQI